MSIDKSLVKALRAEAHRLKLKPVILMGQKGLTDNVHLEIERAINHHELVKIKLAAGDREEKKSCIESICQHHKCHLIQSIGHVIIVFRENPELKKFTSSLT
ncbi:MAG: RNA-binding protein [Gammaproteobacteria bacterium]|jgi:RNA-binding protein